MFYDENKKILRGISKYLKQEALKI